MSDQPQADPTPVRSPPGVTAGAGTPRPGLPTSTIVVGAILIAVLGFGVGFLVGHRTARAAFPFARTGHMGAAPWMRSGEMPGAGMPGSAGYGGMSGTMPGVPAGDQVIAGTVTDVRGDSFTIRTLRGDTVTVVTSSATIVRGVGVDALSSLQPGDQVLVAGVPQADGSIAATHVLEGLFGSELSPAPATPSSGTKS